VIVTLHILVIIALTQSTMETPVKAALPGKISQNFESKEATPWGIAKTKNLSSIDSNGVRYTLTSYTFSTHTTITENKLKHVRAYFLKHRKCRAEILRTPKLEDADGTTWPQIMLGGDCVGDSGFRTLFLISENRLFRLTVSFDSDLPPESTHDGLPANGISPDSPPPLPPPPFPISKLDSLIRLLANQCSFKSYPVTP